MTQDPPFPSDPSAPLEPNAESLEGDDSPAELDPTEALAAGDEPTDDAAAREALAARLAEVLAQRAELEDKFLRKAAELENTKRRLQKQIEETKRFGVEEVVKEMIPVLDDLDLALEHAATTGQPESAVETFRDGMTLVKRKFSAVLERYGVSSFESLGKPFDPKLHEAISQQETADVPDGSVVGEYLKGYMLHDRLLRPALVIVAKKPAEP